MTDPKTGKFAGVTVGPAGRLGGSVTTAKTETWGLRGLLDKLLDKLLPKTTPPSTSKTTPKDPPPPPPKDKPIQKESQ